MIFQGVCQLKRQDHSRGEQATEVCKIREGCGIWRRQIKGGGILPTEPENNAKRWEMERAALWMIGETAEQPSWTRQGLIALGKRKITRKERPRNEQRPPRSRRETQPQPTFKATNITPLNISWGPLSKRRRLNAGTGRRTRGDQKTRSALGKRGKVMARLHLLQGGKPKAHGEAAGCGRFGERERGRQWGVGGCVQTDGMR